MTLTCYCCPAKVAVAGRASRLAAILAALGWTPYRAGWRCLRCEAAS